MRLALQHKQWEQDRAGQPPQRGRGRGRSWRGAKGRQEEEKETSGQQESTGTLTRSMKHKKNR